MPTQFQIDTQAELDRLGIRAKASNKSLTLTIPEGAYDFEQLRIPAHVSMVASSNAPRSVRLRYVGSGNETAIEVSGGYGSLVSGFEILSQKPVPNLTAFSFRDCKNSSFENSRIDIRGVDNIGVSLNGRESLKLECVESRASVPLVYSWGDNSVIRDADLGCSGNNQDLPSTVVWITGMPANLTFDGYQTWQGGQRAMYGVVQKPNKGQAICIYNLRYEQSSALDDPTKAAIDLTFGDRAMENLVIIGSRWTVRKAGIRTQGVDQLTTMGSFLPGTKT